jgi:hypothetical protein
MVTARVSSNDPIEADDVVERSVYHDVRRDSRTHRRVIGQIVQVAPQGDYFHLHLRNQAILPVGTPVKVYRGPASRGMAMTVLEVTESRNGWANARLTGSTRGIRVNPGDEIEALQ